MSRDGGLWVRVRSGAEKGQSGCGALAPSAYPTSAFLLEGVLVFRDAFEKRVVSCLGLHIILDFFSCLGNLRESKASFQPLFGLVSPKETDSGQGGDCGQRGGR